MSHIGTSSNIEEVSFASTRPLIKRIAVREALSWSIDRQSLIDQLWGAVTFSPSVAASALFSQGQAEYPRTGGHLTVGPDDDDDDRSEHGPERTERLSLMRARRPRAEWLRARCEWLDDDGGYAARAAHGGRSE